MAEYRNAQREGNVETNGNKIPLVEFIKEKTKVRVHEKNGQKDGQQLAGLEMVDIATGEDADKMEDEEINCGIMGWRPKCLQQFNNPQCLLFFFCLYVLTLGFVVNGVNNVNTTSIERRFNMSSARVGFISSAYDISASILGLLISYFGAGRHKARMVGIAVIISSLGSIIMAMPHFMAGPYRLGEDSDTLLCISQPAANSSFVQCEDGVEKGLSNYLYVFVLGQLLHGVGGTTVYTVGVALIDDSVKPSSTPLYLGILYGSAILGPGLGYVVGGQFLTYYVDFDVVDTRMEPDDPRWVGAWWLGFILAAALNLLLALPILCFGAELPMAKNIKKSRISQAHVRKNKGISGHSNVTSLLATSELEGGRSLRHFFKTSLSLLSNPCFLFISLSMATEGISLSGVATFMPKMIEKKFRVSASWAAILSGLAVVPSAATGQFLGGFVAKKMDLGIQGLIKLCILGMTLTLISVAIVWIDCGQEDFVGVNTPYPLSTSEGPISLTSQCNAACHCKTDIYKPVCDANNTLYFSPCHAGCSALSENGTYSSCGCIKSAEGLQTGDWSNSTVQSSGCRQSCDILYFFLVLLFILIGFNMIAVPPGDAVQLRCVPEENKTFAQGLKQMIVRVLGTVVGPVITGRLLDDTCQVWRQRCDGTNLSCWLYDTNKMSSSAYVGVVSTKIMSIIFCCLALCLYRPPPPAVVVPAGDRRSEEVSKLSVCEQD